MRKSKEHYPNPHKKNSLISETFITFAIKTENMKKLSYLLPIMLILVSCNLFIGDEILRLQFNCNDAAGMENIEYQISLLKGDKIAFWTETEMEYGSKPDVFYDVEITWSEDSVKNFELGIFDVNPTVKELKTSNGTKTKHRYNGKLAEFIIPEDGDYNFNVTLYYPVDSDFLLKKADFVIRQ